MVFLLPDITAGHQSLRFRDDDEDPKNKRTKQANSSVIPIRGLHQQAWLSSTKEVNDERDSIAMATYAFGQSVVSFGAKLDGFCRTRLPSGGVHATRLCHPNFIFYNLF